MAIKAVAGRNLWSGICALAVVMCISGVPSQASALEPWPLSGDTTVSAVEVVGVVPTVTVDGTVQLASTATVSLSDTSVADLAEAIAGQLPVSEVSSVPASVTIVGVEGFNAVQGRVLGIVLGILMGACTFEVVRRLWLRGRDNG